jgi:hypothetical protein
MGNKAKMQRCERDCPVLEQLKKYFGMSILNKMKRDGAQGTNTNIEEENVTINLSY